jgi:hypothetical protein
MPIICLQEYNTISKCKEFISAYREDRSDDYCCQACVSYYNLDILPENIDLAAAMLYETVSGGGRTRAQGTETYEDPLGW